MAAAATSAPIAERRMCSVLFVDLVGFTSVSANRDPEEVRELLSRYFARASMVVGRYGGVIEKFIGDAVMAVWGTPVATEEDAERAVRAALDLVESVSVLGSDVGISELAARAGVLTGEVAVTVGAMNEGMVAGDAVNTAARIQSVAPPGGVFVDGVTRRLTSVAIAYADAGEFALKGKTEPEHLWRAGRVLTSVGGSDRIDGLEAAMVGRDAEFRALRDLFHAAIDRRQPRLMLVTGVAGVGKSRLGWEFEKYVDGLADTVYWHRGRCSAYGDGITFRSLAEAVRQRLGIAEEDPPELAATRLHEGLVRFVPETAREFVGSRLGRLLGVRYGNDSGATLPQADLFAGWRQFFEHLAADHGVVLLIEDTHHAAPEMLAFLDHLIEWAGDLPIFVVVFARPDIDHHQPGFGTGRNRIHITLDPLDATSMTTLVDELLPGAPDHVIRMIVDRAQGVPLYATESIRALIDRDVVQAVNGNYRVVGDIGHLEVPDSLHSLLAARLDTLDPLTRRVVTDAAVLGASFPADAVQVISELDDDSTRQVLDELLRRGLLTVSADRLSPERGSYRFTQEMLRQVAYESMSRRDRAAKHLAVAAHLRATFPNDGEEVIDVVARHYLDALDAMGSDDISRGDVRDAGVDALIRAARRAERSGSHLRAFEAYRDAGRRLEDAGRAVDGAEWYLRAGDTGRVLGQESTSESIKVLDRAREIFTVAGDERGRARASARLVRQHIRSGHITLAIQLGREAWEQLREQHDYELLQVLRALGMAHHFDGDQDESTRCLEAANLLAHELRADDATFAEVLNARGLIAIQRGLRRDAELYLAEAARLAHIADHPGLELESLCNLSHVLLLDRPFDGIEPCKRALEIAEQHGNPAVGEAARMNLTLAYLETGDWDRAAALVAAGPLSRNNGDDYLLTSATVAGLRGDIEAMAPDWESSLTRAPDSEDPEDIAHLALTRALLADARGDASGAMEHALATLDPIDRQPFASDAGKWAWPFAARLAHRLGRYDDERRMLAMHDRQHAGAAVLLQHAEAMLIRARLAAVDGRPDVAEQFSAAIAKYREVVSVYHFAHALADHAEFLGPADPVAAEHLAEAAAIAERLGCRPLQRRIAGLTNAASHAAT